MADSVYLDSNQCQLSYQQINKFIRSQLTKSNAHSHVPQTVIIVRLKRQHFQLYKFCHIMRTWLVFCSTWIILQIINARKFDWDFLASKFSTKNSHIHAFLWFHVNYIEWYCVDIFIDLTCLTPDNLNGICIPLVWCGPLLHIVYNIGRSTQAQLEFVKRSRCQTNGTLPTVNVNPKSSSFEREYFKSFIYISIRNKQ